MSYTRRSKFANVVLGGFAAFGLLVLISIAQVFAQANAKTEVATDQCRPREKSVLPAFNKTEPRPSRPGETENCSGETSDEEANAVNPVKEFTDRITEPDLGGGESDDRLRLRPEAFIQGRLRFAPKLAFEHRLSIQESAVVPGRCRQRSISNHLEHQVLSDHFQVPNRAVPPGKGQTEMKRAN